MWFWAYTTDAIAVAGDCLFRHSVYWNASLLLRNKLTTFSNLSTKSTRDLTTQTRTQPGVAVMSTPLGGRAAPVQSDSAVETSRTTTTSSENHDASTPHQKSIKIDEPHQSPSSSQTQTQTQTQSTNLALSSLHRPASDPTNESASSKRRHLASEAHALPPRRSLSYAQRADADAYYDSRAATRREWKRRAKTLQEYYHDNPHLLPQLPFTWHHGWRRWRLFIFAFLVFVDASAVPIALYYGMRYAGDVEGWIIFAVVTTIWGGPTYLEFAIRTLRLIKKERFYRPLGTDSRWCFDVITHTSTITITVVTALFVVGSAPHDVFLRVLCMPAPSILYCVGGVLAATTLYHHMGWKAPFRLSSTAKGEPVSFYILAHCVAVFLYIHLTTGL